MLRTALVTLCILGLAPTTALAQPPNPCDDPCAHYKPKTTKRLTIAVDTTLRRPFPDTNFFVGEKNRDSAKSIAPVTLTVEQGAVITGESSAERNADGASIFGVNLYGDNEMVVRGGSTATVRAHDTAAVTVVGGKVDGIDGKNNTAVDILGGTVGTAYVFGSGTLDIVGGDVSNNAAVFDSATMNISGGKIDSACGCGKSVVNISGGTISSLSTTNGAGTINISGGVIESVSGLEAGDINIAGGTVGEVMAQFNCNVSIRGGTVGYVVSNPLSGRSKIAVGGGAVRGIVLCAEGATVNFDGAGLRYKYAGVAHFRARFIEGDADKFVVSGTLGGKTASYNVLVLRPEGTSVPLMPNATPRQFTFNNAAVAAPQPNTWIPGAVFWLSSALVVVAYYFRRR